MNTEVSTFLNYVLLSATLRGRDREKDKDGQTDGQTDRIKLNRVESQTHLNIIGRFPS